MTTSKISTIWSEISPEFVSDANGLLKVVTNVDSVKAAINNILKTRKGERVMIPDFGSSLQDILFEPLNSTAIKLLARTVKDDIEKWDDRVIVETVNVYPNPDESSLSLTIGFRIRGFTNIFSHSVDFGSDIQ